MANIFNDDFRDFIASLNTNKVEYVLVGGYSVILHGYNRTTGDMDVWVNKSEENYNRLTMAFADFWMPMFEMTKDAFLNDHAMDVFTFGRQPSSLNIMTGLKDWILSMLRREQAFTKKMTWKYDLLISTILHRLRKLQAGIRT